MPVEGASSSSFSDRITAIHRKLAPPRSLHGVEDAAVVWETIMRRFPNAAPLLCEMETVIERAEDLLEQLRTPCASQADDTSGSFHTPDSRESNATISMVSDIESYAEETNVPEHAAEAVETVETQLTVHDIDERPTDDAELRYPRNDRRSERSVQCERDYPDEERPKPSAVMFDRVAQHPEASSTNERADCQQGSKENAGIDDEEVGVTSDERSAKIIAEGSSLEGWARVVGGALQEWPGDAANVGAPGELADDDWVARPSVDGEAEKRSTTIADGCDRESHGTNDAAVTKNDSQAGIVGSSSTVAGRRRRRRSPLIVLEEYARRCKVPIKYECRKPKANLHVINGDLCGFRATSCAGTQDLAKNELAAKLLWLVAERQMDGTKLSSSVCGLSDLTRGEMLEIIAFNKDELKNATQKIYKSCLERGEPAPEYSVRNLKTNLGFRYTAQCAALGYVGTGQGPRRDSAKIAAAENLYEKYSHDVQERRMRCNPDDDVRSELGS